jgi:hypothetical protein
MQDVCMCIQDLMVEILFANMYLIGNMHTRKYMGSLTFRSQTCLNGVYDKTWWIEYRVC